MHDLFCSFEGVLPLIETQAGAEAFVQETGHEKILEYLFDEKIFEYLSWLLIYKMIFFFESEVESKIDNFLKVITYLLSNDIYMEYSRYQCGRRA